MLELLREKYKSSEYLSIYTNSDNTQSFHFGKIISVNKNETAIEMLSPKGEYDGIMVLSTDLIYRIETDGLYSEKMRKLYSLNEPLPSFDIDCKRIKQEILELSMKHKKVVSIELENSGINDVVGIAKSVDNTLCCIKVIDDYGMQDGITYVNFNSITKICFDSQDEQIILELWQANNK